MCNWAELIAWIKSKYWNLLFYSSLGFMNLIRAIAPTLTYLYIKALFSGTKAIRGTKASQEEESSILRDVFGLQTIRTNSLDVPRKNSLEWILPSIHIKYDYKIFRIDLKWIHAKFSQIYTWIWLQFNLLFAAYLKSDGRMSQPGGASGYSRRLGKSAATAPPCIRRKCQRMLSISTFKSLLQCSSIITTIDHIHFQVSSRARQLVPYVLRLWLKGHHNLLP